MAPKAVAAPKAGTAAAAQKAVKAAKGARVGVQKKNVRVRTKVHFYRPKTQKLARDPRYKRSLPSARGADAGKMDKFAVIKSPLTTESAMKKIEDNNTLVFLVHPRANKRMIKAAVQSLYDIKTAKINTRECARGRSAGWCARYCRHSGGAPSRSPPPPPPPFSCPARRPEEGVRPAVDGLRRA